jgi:phosphatidylglycerol:prolipoprotein diacylglycerol transferase
VLLGQAIGRWGNFFNQEAYGVETSVPWAMYIAGAYRHPTFLYESLWDLAGFLILFFVLRKRRTFDGELVLWYALLYSSGRIWVEGLRTDSLMWGPIRVAQLVSAILIVLSIGLIVSGRRRAKAGQAQITLPPHE